MSTPKNILICPLEWGLGHAGRMIPLAKKLKELQNNVFIASGEEHLSLFREEVQGLSYIHFPGFRPRYSGFLPQYLVLLLKIPALIMKSFSEHKKLKKIISDYNIDIVISDNRFGLWNKKITSVYVTHMPVIPFPKGFRFMEWTGALLHRLIINRYSFCLIPDLPGRLNLTGRLSHGIKLPVNSRFIGILSRFADHTATGEEDKFPYPRRTVILSGPEPQKTIFGNKIRSLLKDDAMVTIVLEGKPGKSYKSAVDNNFLTYPHLPSAEMGKVISGSDLVISRPGYTTLMELVSLNCSALIIPTPGQTEQGYLANYLSAKGWFRTASQKDLKPGIQLSAGILPQETREIMEESRKLQDKVISEILEDHDNQDKSQ